MAVDALTPRQAVIQQISAAYDSFAAKAREAETKVEQAAMTQYGAWTLRAYLAESSSDKHPSPRVVTAKCGACRIGACDRCAFCRSFK